MKNIKEFINNIPRKFLLISVIAIAIIALAIILIIGFTKDGKITASDLVGYKNYYSKSAKISFDFPEDYKVKKENNIFYIFKKFKNKEAIKPYITIKIEKNFSDAKEYLEDSTKESKEEYGHSFTPVTEMLATLIGDKYTSKLTYNNFYNGELIVENRYAFVLNGVVYVVQSFETDNNSEEITEISKNIILSIKIED